MKEEKRSTWAPKKLQFYLKWRLVTSD
jgi:hypothetical protein